MAEGRALEDGSDGRLTLIHDRFSNMVSALGARGVAEVDAVTFDIGVSSMQPGRAERGFSFQSDGPLDTRSEEHTSELQSLMRRSYAVFCLQKKKTETHQQKTI